ncbi:hypothetical protein ACK1KB_04490 [Chryseobacterium sp. TY3]
MKFLEVGSFGGDLAVVGMFFLAAGLVAFCISALYAIILAIMSASNRDKKYSFKPALYGILFGLLIFTAGGFICGFSL